MTSNNGIATRLYWAGHIRKHAPKLLFLALSAGVADRLSPERDSVRICVGTHHKILTVFLSRVFRSFAAATGRRHSLGQGAAVDTSATVLIDHHSRFDWGRIAAPFVGLHVTRDPRDLVVSSMFYHLKSSETWLHRPLPAFEGRTYQEAIRALPDVEARLLFEIEHSAGRGIAEMLAWQQRPEIAEVRYDQLVGPGARAVFDSIVAAWPLPPRDRRLLGELFEYFSLGNPGARGNAHIRNATSGQWRTHFTPRVMERFHERFPDAVERLGYTTD